MSNLLLVLIAIIVLVILFDGDPDLHDALLSNISHDCLVLNSKEEIK